MHSFIDGRAMGTVEFFKSGIAPVVVLVILRTTDKKGKAIWPCLNI